MSEMILSEGTLALLQDPGLGTQDVDGKVRYLLEAEYMRRLAASGALSPHEQSAV